MRLRQQRSWKERNIFRLRLAHTIKSVSYTHLQEIANADNSEEKNAIKQKYEKTYQSEIDKLHQMQFEADVYKRQKITLQIL